MMGKIQVLDCTLRDGGYANDWLFGEKYIKRIITGLQESCIDIIECGYLTEKGSSSSDSTSLMHLEQFEKNITQEASKHMPSYVCMIDYGNYNIDKLPVRGNGYINGIRIAFHKNDAKAAVQMCRDIQKMGYDVYVQPMVTLSYTDTELLDLLKEINTFCPKAFYIVDSYGSMRRRDLLRLFYLVAHNLNKNTIIGYHSHNNLQLAYSNAQSLVEDAEERELIIDSSIFGMGRGAGNLNTELFIDYLNNLNGGKYKVAPLLKVMDSVISQIYMITPWGYSLPYYLSAIHNCHPNYASYLAKKNTLTVEDINAVFSMMLKEKKNSFDESYLEILYEKYMSRNIAYEEGLENVNKALANKEVLLIAPGKTVREDRSKIQKFQETNNILTIAINSDFPDFKIDYIFVSNIRRFEELDHINYTKAIITCNIQSKKVFAKLSYIKLENENKAIKDNAGIMALSLMKMMGVKKVFLAGFDGYSADMHSNYATKSLYLKTDEGSISDINNGMKKAIIQLKECMDIAFLTRSRLDAGEGHEGK